MARMQKLTWEHVSAITHPEVYAGDGPAVHREDIPEGCWAPVETVPRASVDGQYDGICALIERGELIRNLRRYEAEIPDVEWTDTTTGAAVQSRKPTTCQILRYRGKLGFNAVRAAIVTADVETLDPRGVEAGVIPALDSDQHVHLWVFTPGESGGFTEYNVAQGDEPGQWSWPAP